MSVAIELIESAMLVGRFSSLPAKRAAGARGGGGFGRPDVCKSSAAVSEVPGTASTSELLLLLDTGFPWPNLRLVGGGGGCEFFFDWSVSRIDDVRDTRGLGGTGGCLLASDPDLAGRAGGTGLLEASSTRAGCNDSKSKSSKETVCGILCVLAEKFGVTGCILLAFLPIGSVASLSPSWLESCSDVASSREDNGESGVSGRVFFPESVCLDINELSVLLPMSRATVSSCSDRASALPVSSSLLNASTSITGVCFAGSLSLLPVEDSLSIVARVRAKGFAGATRRPGGGWLS